MDHLQDKIPLTRKEKAVLGGGAALAALLVASVAWTAFAWGGLQARQSLLLSDQAEIRGSLTSIRQDNEAAYAATAQAVAAARKMHELAAQMSPDPFAKGARK